MGENSKIEWTDATWNPIRAQRLDTGKTGWHCEKVSPACQHCYAETFNGRELPSGGTGLSYKVESRRRVRMLLHDLQAPLRWKRPRRIFVCSMTDLFGEFVDFELVDAVFGVIEKATWHTFQILTKRPQRMLWYLTSGHSRSVERDPIWPLPNVHVGVTAENQATANERISVLLQCPAAVRFLSAEPLLGPIDIQAAINRMPWMIGGGDAPLHWVIVGGESGHKARPMHPDWVVSLRDQCRAAEVPFFFKQWGEYVCQTELGPLPGHPPISRIDCSGRDVTGLPGLHHESDAQMVKLGKKLAGRHLHGIQHNEFPKVADVG